MSKVVKPSPAIPCEAHVRLHPIKVILCVTVACVILLFSSCYVLDQGWRMLSERDKAIEVSKLRGNSSTTTGTRTFLELIGRIRDFGTKQIGLKDTENYTRYVKVDRDYLVTVVNACKPLSFDRYTWSFPFFGDSPYLGFFNEDGAKEEAKKLKAAGYDVWLRRVDAFSTLGWLKDPLYSFMESYRPDELANLILHEQLHATIWVSGNFDFNEQLASFVGDNGSLLFIANEYGVESQEYKNALDSRADSNRFYTDMASLRDQLATLYASNEDAAAMTMDKVRIIQSFKDEFTKNYNDSYKTPNYRGVPSIEINNAFVDLYEKYGGRRDLFQAYFDAESQNIGTFLDTMRQAAKSKDAFAWLDEHDPRKK